MKNRRSFLQAAFYSSLGSALISFPDLTFGHNSKNSGIVMQPDEGETYIVRENTPITIKVSKKTQGVDSVSICTEEILPGNGIAIHKHLNEDEIFFFHRGDGIFLLEDSEIKVKEGCSAFVPKGTWHGLKNTGKEVIVFTFGYCPSGFEDFFRQIGTLKGTPFRAKSPEELKAIAAKYGMVYK